MVPVRRVPYFNRRPALLGALPRLLSPPGLVV